MRMTFALCLFVSPVLQPVALHCFSTHTWSITRLIHQSSTRHQPAGQCSSVNCPHVNSVWLRPHSCVLLFPSHVRSCPRCWTTVFSSSLSHYCRTISLKVSLNSKSLILMVPHILSSNKQNNIWPAHHQQVISDHDLLIEDLCCSEVCFVCLAHCLCLFIKQRNISSHWLCY